MTEIERQQQIDDAYRAIGRYVVTFSHLIRNMRQLAERRLTPTVDSDPALAEIAFGGAPARSVADSFFGMCRRVADFDADEQRVEKALRAAVLKAIEQRNDIGHGDWYVGLGAWNAEQVEDPVVERVHALRTAGHEEEITYSVQRLDETSDGLAALTCKVVEFGKLALGLPVLLVPKGVSRELRVRDVYTPHGPKKAPTIARDGPRAAEVAAIAH